jgi:hypothetical protein
MLKHTKKLLALFFVLAISVIFISCQDDQSIPTANDQISLPKLGEFSLPAGVTLTSATLFVYEEVYDNDHVINVHKVTSDWTENLVTWNTKPTYDAALTSFNSFPGAGWRSVVITALVQDWIDNGGNYGLLLDEVAALGGFAHYNSRENATNQPYLHLVTSVGDTDLAPIADCSIWENEPDNNKNGEILTVGRSNVTGFIKQSLIQFEYVAPPVEVCETAYAYGGSIATCFLDITPRSANNWGWTNLISPGYTGQWPLYAGAGQCDISKGTLVGHVDVSYIGGTITIDYVLDTGYNLNEKHVWIGTTLLPLKNGIYQNAPGKFNYNNLDPVVVTGQTGNKYVAVHAGVCWFEEQ